MVFTRLESRIEIITVALFGLTYSAIKSALTFNAMALSKLWMALGYQMDALKNAVIPDFYVDPKDQAEARSEHEKAMYPAWFELFGLSVLSLFCLYKVYVVLGGFGNAK